MTATEASTADVLSDYLLAAAEAARSGIPGAAGWTVAAGEITTVLPASGSRAVQSQIGAVTLLLVADPDLARHLQVGPPPANDLLEGSQPALGAAALALVPMVDPSEPAEPIEIDPSSLADTPGATTVVAHLLEEGVHRASLVLVAPAPETADAPTETLRYDEVPTNRLASVPTGLELLHEVEMGVTAELGRTRMLVREVLELVPGSVIELDRAAGSPVDVLVNGTLIARGEVVVIDEEFGIRITEVVGYEEPGSR